MNTWTKAGIGALLIAALLLVTGFMCYANANDTEIALRENVEAKQKVCESNRDKLHQTLSNMVGVPQEFMEKSKEAFKEIYPDLITGRYDNSHGGALMSWITESNPQFDMASAAGLYENLQVAIESNFKEFDKHQQELISAQQEHSVYIQKTWNNVFWSFRDRGEVDITILKSNRVMEEYANDGQYEGVDLFEEK